MYSSFYHGSCGENEIQKENLFQTRCLVMGNLCSLIIDGGSCANVASARLVSKLNLETKSHPRPYKLQFLGEDGEMTVNKQVEVGFSIGRYEDVVLCDVVPIDVCHLLLGKPWKLDRNVAYSFLLNKFSFVHMGRKVKLTGLSPSEASEDRNKLRKKIENERKEKEIKEREMRENELREKEKEMREKEMIEKEREKDKENELNSSYKLDYAPNHINSSILIPTEELYIKDQWARQFDEMVDSYAKPDLPSSKANELDSRTNPFEEGGNDMNQPRVNKFKDHLQFEDKFSQLKNNNMESKLSPTINTQDASVGWSLFGWIT